MGQQPPPRDGAEGAGVIALVMAAGASRRFGDADKRVARLPDGRTLLSATVANLRSGFGDVRVVIGTDDSPADLNLSDFVPVIRAPNASLGMGSSIADAVRTLDQGQTVAICLGDMPWIQPETLTLLRSNATEDGITRPIYQDQPGHPVIFGRTYWPELCTLNGDQGGRGILCRYPAQCRFVEVEDPGVLADMDNPPIP